jgi:hypothetical protein
MAEFLLSIGSLYTESEFNAGVGACGPTALAVGGRWVNQKRTPIASEMMASMRQMGLCGPTGVTNMPQLEAAARNLHYRTRMRPAGVSPLSFAARVLMGSYGAPGVVVYECTNGQVLTDYLFGSGEDAGNLKNHILALVGYNTGGYSNFFGCQVPAGFIACDGCNNMNNPVVRGSRVHRFINTLYVYYTTAILEAGQPYDSFAVIPN